MRVVKQLILKAIRSAGYDIRHNPYHRISEPDSGKPVQPTSPFVDVLPVGDVPWVEVDLTQSANPLPAIMDTAAFRASAVYFANNPAASRSLVSADTQALLFSLIRNQRAQCVVEIGSFRCGTAEAICRALHANGSGKLLTVDPFGAATVPGIIAWWPAELQNRVHFIPSNSADFFMEMERQGLHPDLVFVDGNHDYEFALFDIQCAARRIAPGGFICVDNISQAGPFFAGVDFLKANPDWTECGTSARHYNASKAFDRDRTSIHNTDIMVLRAPDALSIGERPMTSGDQSWTSNSVHGLRLTLAPGNQPGVLHLQCVVRGFGDELIETTGEASIEIDGRSTAVSAPLVSPVTLPGKYNRIGVEPWLIWQGQEPLRLLEPPAVF